MSFAFTSCAITSEIPPSPFDPIYSNYPKYRIDDVVKKVILIPDGELSNSLQSTVEEFFIRELETEVIEPVNLQSVIGSAILGYNSEITQEQAQAISQILQADHFLFYKTIPPTHESYKFGGRVVARIDFKIVDPISSKVVFSSHSQFVNKVVDPRKYGHSYNTELLEDQKAIVLGYAFDILSYQLRYAFGKASSGWGLSGDLTVLSVFLEGPAYNAGIRRGDRIVEYDSIPVNSIAELRHNPHIKDPEQGTTRQVKVNRNNKVLEFKLEYPIIPLSLKDIEKPKEAIHQG
jgi:hypothetical protein